MYQNKQIPGFFCFCFCKKYSLYKTNHTVLISTRPNTNASFRLDTQPFHALVLGQSSWFLIQGPYAQQLTHELSGRHTRINTDV